MDAPAARVAAHATDERSCAQRGRDAVDQVVGCVEQRLSHYRATGQFAVAFGWPVLRRRLAAQVEAALGRPGGGGQQPRTAAEAAGAPWPTREPPAVDPNPEIAPEPPRTEVGSASDAPAAPGAANAPGATNTTHSTNGHGSPAASELAIPGYDSLSASQVVERLAGLPSDDLDEVHDYESAHRNRRTILGKIDQLRTAH